MIEAKIILDSISTHGIRLTTIQTKAPKFLDAEFEKHRMISSNSSSDRALPPGYIPVIEACPMNDGSAMVILGVKL